jgi:ParB-like chromosome segregation protein Spo0J
MTLLSGAATFEACLEERMQKVPAVVVRTKGGADELLFSLQSSELSAPPDAMYTSAAVVSLIDDYSMPRRAIAESLGKSPAWVSRMEGLRKLSDAVRVFVSDGIISSRAAQEIARLPKEAQAPFAVSAGGEYLTKDEITFLVNCYLDASTSLEERGRIVGSPRQALPEAPRGRGAKAMDQSIDARLARAMARCNDCASYLLNLLDSSGAGQAAVNMSDAATLAAALSALADRLGRMICPRGSEADGDG